MALATAAICTGCVHYGPKTVVVDRFDYSTAIADSWKEQTLLNIVKIRYMDSPVFVEVASIVAGYSIDATVSTGGGVNWPSIGSAAGNLSVGAIGRYSERPTITYVPMTGEKFLRGLITPIDPKQIFFMLQSGYPADFILGLTVESLNGLRNRSAVGGTVREADPEFVHVLELLRDVQWSGAVGMRVEQDEIKGETGVLIFSNDDVAPGIAEKSAEIRRLLKLRSDARNFALRYSPIRGTEDELAVNSRSMLQIMQAFASYVDVPVVHLSERRATPAFSGPSLDGVQPQVRIHCSKGQPADAFAAVFYRGHWFWVDDSDLRTKRALSAIMFFFTLADTGGETELPLITISAQ